MLSIMNEIDPCLLLPLCVLYEIQNEIFQQFKVHFGAENCYSCSAEMVDKIVRLFVCG